MWEYAEDECSDPGAGLAQHRARAAVAVGAALMIAICLLRISRQKLATWPAWWPCWRGGRCHVPGAGWLQAIGNWNLVVFFGLVLGVSVLLGIPIAFCFGLATVASWRP
jgi:hypothetical protein